MCVLINAVAMVFAKLANASVSQGLGAKTVAFKLKMCAQRIALVMVSAVSEHASVIPGGLVKLATW
jgi:hypothetical protein